MWRWGGRHAVEAVFGGYRSEREEFEHWYLRGIQMLLLFVQVGFDLKTQNTYIPAVR